MDYPGNCLGYAAFDGQLRKVYNFVTTLYTSGTGVRATVEEISTEVEDLGLPAANKSGHFRAALIYLENELVKNELVSLFKKAGLSKQDINIL